MASRGTVYFRESDNRWVGKLQLPKDPLTGKSQKPKYVYSSLPKLKGRQEVERKLEALIREIDSGDLSSINKMTVAGWLTKYLEVYCANKATTTTDGYRIYIDKHIIPAIGSILLHELKSIHIENYYNKEREVDRGKDKEGNPIIGYSEKTILQEHRILRRAFQKALVDGLIPRNPCEGIDAPSPKTYKPAVYNADEYLLLLDKLKGQRMEATVLIVGMCGLRRGEFAGLNWHKSIDLDKAMIYVNETVVATSKGKEVKDAKNESSTRNIAIPSAIIPRLKQLQGIGRVLTRLDGQDLHPGSISRMFNEFLKENDLKHIRFHDLRHFNATMMLKNNISDKEAATRLGHSDPSITRKLYQHVLEEMDKSNADQLNNIFVTPKDARKVDK